LNNWLKFYEAITKPLPVASSLFLLVATSFLLFGSAPTLNKLGLSNTITEYRWIVALGFIIAATWLVVTSLIWVGKQCLQAWTKRQAEKKQQKRLHALTVDERRILLRYVENEIRTQIFIDAPDLGAAQGLADDGVLYRPDVALDGVAVTYNIQEWALAYLSRNRGLVAAVVSTETRWSGTSMLAKSPDWFARGVALVAIGLTVIGLYFTHRTYNWQTKESLEERILLRAGFKYTIAKNSGDVSVDVVNIGMHPIFVEAVQIEVPCELMTEAPRTLGECQQCKLEACALAVYRRDPTHSNKSMKPLEPGSEASYTMESWDFSKFPLQEWVKTKNLQDELWVQVDTTKQRLRQHPFSSWYQINDAKGVKVYLPNASQ
jgi:hypothetical protein